MTGYRAPNADNQEAILNYLQSGGVRAQPFDPAGTVSLPVTSASSRVALPVAGSTMIVRNYGPSRAYIKRTSASGAATVADYPVEGAYTVECLYRDPGVHTHLAAVCANPGETAMLSISCGDGINR